MDHSAVAMTLDSQDPAAHRDQDERRRDGLLAVLARDAQHADDRRQDLDAEVAGAQQTAALAERGDEVEGVPREARRRRRSTDRMTRTVSGKARPNVTQTPGMVLILRSSARNALIMAAAAVVAVGGGGVGGCVAGGRCRRRHVAEPQPGGEREEDRLEVAAFLGQLVQDDLVGGQQRPDLLGGHAVHRDLVVAEPAEGDAGLGEDAGEAVGLGGAGPHDDAGDALRDLGQRPLRLQLPERHDDRVVDGLGHFRQQVGGHEDGAALAGEIPHEVAQPGDALRVEPVGRLVEDEDVGIADQGRGQFQALAHAHGEATDLALGVTGQADEPEDLVGALLVVAAGTGRHAQVRAGAARRVEAGRLQHGTRHWTWGSPGPGSSSRRWSRSRRRDARGRAACAGSSSCPSRWVRGSR